MTKLNCMIIAFYEDRAYLNSFSEFHNFVEYTLDNNFEIIASISNYEDINEDDGIGALSVSLQSNTWSSARMKDKIIKNEISDSVKERKAEEIPYEQLKEDLEYDNLLEKMNEIRRVNMNSNLSDEERRKNAENAILMFAKFLKLDEGEEDECQDDDDD
jgi:hypothetical protein